MFSSRKYPYPAFKRSLEISMGVRGVKCHFFKRKYEVKLEFREGERQGCQPKNIEIWEIANLPFQPQKKLLIVEFRWFNHKNAPNIQNFVPPKTPKITQNKCESNAFLCIREIWWPADLVCNRETPGQSRRVGMDGAEFKPWKPSMGGYEYFLEQHNYHTTHYR